MTLSVKCQTTGRSYAYLFQDRWVLGNNQSERTQSFGTHKHSRCIEGHQNSTEYWVEGVAQALSATKTFREIIYSFDFHVRAKRASLVSNYDAVSI